MFKKDNCKSIIELEKKDFKIVDMIFSKSFFGKRMYIWSILPLILTVVVVIYEFSNEISKGYLDISNIGLLLIVGFGITSITKILYLYSLANFYKDFN